MSEDHFPPPGLVMFETQVLAGPCGGWGVVSVFGLSVGGAGATPFAFGVLGVW